MEGAPDGGAMVNVPLARRFTESRIVTCWPTWYDGLSVDTVTANGEPV